MKTKKIKPDRCQSLTVYGWSGFTMSMATKLEPIYNSVDSANNSRQITSESTACSQYVA